MQYSRLLSRRGYAAGGIAGIGRHVKGPGDGMSDSIPAQIDGQEPAAIASGEFIWPADVVSMLGNGDNDAGARVLDDCVKRIRQAAIGRTQQQTQIDPSKFLPA